MNKHFNRYPYLKNNSTIIEPQNNLVKNTSAVTNCTSPITNCCYLAPNHNPHKQISPNSYLKTKIRLVSPQKNINPPSLFPKQNSPPNQKFKYPKYQQVQKQTHQIPLQQLRAAIVGCAAKVQLNEVSNISIVNHLQGQGKPTCNQRLNCKKARAYYISRSPINVTQLSRPVSPQRVILNNKTFDVRTHQLQVPYQTIFDQRRVFANQVNMMEIKRKVEVVQLSSGKSDWKNDQYGQTLPTDLAIQQENNLEQLKQSYEKQIKQIGNQTDTQQQNNQFTCQFYSNKISEHNKSHKEIQEQLLKEGIQMVSTINGEQSHPNFFSNSQNIQNKSQSSYNQQAHQSIQRIPQPQVDSAQNTVPIASEHTIINELNIATAKIISSKQQQLSSNLKENQGQEKLQIKPSGFHKKASSLALTRNEDCCINMLIKATPMALQIKPTVILPLKYLATNCLEHNNQKGINFCSQPSLAYLFKTQANICQPQLQNTQPMQKPQKNCSKTQSNSQTSGKSIPNQPQKDTPCKSKLAQNKITQNGMVLAKPKQTKAGTIVSQKIETKPQNKPAITQEEAASIESIIKSKISQSHLNVTLLQNNSSMHSQQACNLQKSQIVSKPLTHGAAGAWCHRKFTNRIYL